MFVCVTESIKENKLQLQKGIDMLESEELIEISESARVVLTWDINSSFWKVEQDTCYTNEMIFVLHTGM